jgi:hypothetical protein
MLECFVANENKHIRFIKFHGINDYKIATKGDLGKDGTSEDGTGFSLIREVKKKK